MSSYHRPLGHVVPAVALASLPYSTIVLILHKVDMYARKYTSEAMFWFTFCCVVSIPYQWNPPVYWLLFRFFWINDDLSKIILWWKPDGLRCPAAVRPCGLPDSFWHETKNIKQKKSLCPLLFAKEHFCSPFRSLIFGLIQPPFDLNWFQMPLWDLCNASAGLWSLPACTKQLWKSTLTIYSLGHLSTGRFCQVMPNIALQYKNTLTLLP